MHELSPGPLEMKIFQVASENAEMKNLINAS